MILLVFAGSAAEFALNRAVDWLFFTGKVPGDPIGRLFATASYAQQIVFADEPTASRTLDRIRAAHEAIERQRGERIPDWAHRDVLYMLIDYSERAHELLAGPLDADEQAELYDVFYRVATGLRIPDLPPSYARWRVDRESHMRRDLVHSRATEALYAQYRLHLGPWRYRLLLAIQSILTPEHVRGLLRLESAEWLRPLVGGLSDPGRRRVALGHPGGADAITVSACAAQPGSRDRQDERQEHTTAAALSCALQGLPPHSPLPLPSGQRRPSSV